MFSIIQENIGKKSGKSYFLKNLDAIFEQFGNLHKKRLLQAGYLSSGEQQMLSVAQGFIRGPEMFVMDEPTAGLSPKLMEAVFDFISFMRTQHITILIVEQNMNKTLKVTDKAYIMEVGKIVVKDYQKIFWVQKALKRHTLEDKCLKE